MTRDQFEATLIQARKFGGFGLDPYFESMRVHDAEQRAEIARLRAALVEIVEKCEDEDWEYMFGDILIKAKQALKETIK